MIYLLNDAYRSTTKRLYIYGHVLDSSNGYLNSLRYLLNNYPYLNKHLFAIMTNAF